MPVSNTKWMTESASARCRATGCPFRKHGTQSAVVSAARRHVEQSGHEVDLTRSQWRMTLPESS